MKVVNVTDIEQHLMSQKARLKILRVSPDVLIKGLVGAVRVGDKIEVRSVTGVPPDVLVQAVVYDFDRNCFVFRLWHPTFDIVPDGHSAPEINPAVETKLVPVLVDARRGPEFL